MQKQPNCLNYANRETLLTYIMLKEELRMPIWTISSSQDGIHDNYVDTSFRYFCVPWE